VAGRNGIVADVAIKDDIDTKCSGQLLIADGELNAAVCQMMFMRAGCLKMGNTRGDGAPPAVAGFKWKDVRELLLKRVVRLLGGEFKNAIVPFIECMRETMHVNMAAWKPYKEQGAEVGVGPFYAARSFMLVLGPVEELNATSADSEEWTEYTRGDGDDDPAPCLLEELDWPQRLSWLAPLNPHWFWTVGGGKGHGSNSTTGWSTTGWPVLPLVKQKPARRTLRGTVKLCVFCGGRQARRTSAAKQHRAATARERLSFWSKNGYSWTTPCTGRKRGNPR